MSAVRQIVVLALFSLCIGEIKGNGNCNEDGQYWVCGVNICYCNGSVTEIIDDLGRCNGNGDVHYTSFDWNTFDFQGVCRYVLARDCCNNSFSIAVEQKQWVSNGQTAISHAFTIRFGNYVIELMKNPPSISVQIGNGPLMTNYALPNNPYDDSELRIERFGPYALVTLKTLGVFFRWEFNWVFSVWVQASFKGHMCGICGDFNDDPTNDLTLTSSGDPPPNMREWGRSWRTVIQPMRCENGTEPFMGFNWRRDWGPRVGVKRQAVPSDEETCVEYIDSAIFETCRASVTKNGYIADCILEMRECRLKGLTGCLAYGLGPYIIACSLRGIEISDEWKEEAGARDCVFDGVTYGHGKSWGVGCSFHTCNNSVVVNSTNPSCCYWGGKIYANGDTWQSGCYNYTCVLGRTIYRRSCCYFRGAKYQNGDKWSYRCYNYTCVEGRYRYYKDPNCCYWGGKTYTNGDKWQSGCYNYTCVLGRTIYRRNCCYYRGTQYRSGDSWSDGCYHYTCTAGRTSYKADCCYFQGAKYQEGDSLSLYCYNYTCTNGRMLRSNRIVDCCYFRGVSYTNGDSWTYGCYEYTCVKGVSTPAKIPGCCYFAGVKYMEGNKWRYGCYNYTCKGGRYERDQIPNCCYFQGLIYKNGQSISFYCYKYTCTNGRMIYSKIPQCCYHGGNRHLNGESWSYLCYNYSCNNGRIQRIGKIPDCCYFQGKTYKSGDTWPYNCGNFSCVNGTLKYEKDPNCCYFIRTKYMNGDFWTYGCYNYTCYKGSTRYINRIPDCCSFRSTNYKVGDSWNYNCYNYTCIANGRHTYKRIANCCSFRGVSYLQGDKWTLGCYNYTCIDGRTLYKKNPDCCQYGNSVYKVGDDFYVPNRVCQKCHCNIGGYLQCRSIFIVCKPGHEIVAPCKCKKLPKEKKEKAGKTPK